MRKWSFSNPLPLTATATTITIIIFIFIIASSITARVTIINDPSQAPSDPLSLRQQKTTTTTTSDSTSIFQIIHELWWYSYYSVLATTTIARKPSQYKPQEMIPFIQSLFSITTQTPTRLTIEKDPVHQFFYLQQQQQQK